MSISDTTIVKKIGNITIKIPKKLGGHKAPYLEFYEGEYDQSKTATLYYDSEKYQWQIKRKNRVSIDAIKDVLIWGMRNTFALLKIWPAVVEKNRAPMTGDIEKIQLEMENKIIKLRGKKKAKLKTVLRPAKKPPRPKPENPKPRKKRYGVFDYEIDDVKAYPNFTIKLVVVKPIPQTVTINAKPLFKWRIFKVLMDPKVFVKIINFGGDHVEWPEPDLLLSVKDLLGLPKVKADENL